MTKYTGNRKTPLDTREFLSHYPMLLCFSRVWELLEIECNVGDRIVRHSSLPFLWRVRQLFKRYLSSRCKTSKVFRLLRVVLARLRSAREHTPSTRV